jgi:hypothetical protein
MIEPGGLNAARAAGAPIEQAVATFMLHPETFGGSVAAGYENPLAGYVAPRSGTALPGGPRRRRLAPTADFG